MQNSIYSNRQRKEPKKILATMGMKPKEIVEGEMIGLYESKQDIYLTFAHRCNALQEEVDSLTERIKKLENK